MSSDIYDNDEYLFSSDPILVNTSGWTTLTSDKSRIKVNSQIGNGLIMITGVYPIFIPNVPNIKASLHYEHLPKLNRESFNQDIQVGAVLEISESSQAVRFLDIPIIVGSRVPQITPIFDVPWQLSSPQQAVGRSIRLSSHTTRCN